ncbi:MAG: TonB-dependent receptor [Chthoniobacterales bacterium]|nr:TonB-dependent receptor [Chthoniobacterales bacterium]
MRAAFFAILCGGLPLQFFSLGKAHGQEAVADAITVSADRLPTAESAGPFALRSLEAEELRRAPQVRLDDILRAQVPGFSLFRRSSSRVANPTTQGVTLRNFGPSGAGRTLVLLDGIPLNDPFAGYVQWNQLPPATLENVIVTPGGGASLFGNAALAGTIFVTSKREEENSAFVQGLIGNADTNGVTFGATLADKPASFSVWGERFFTGGYPVLQKNQRGSVDNNASSDSDLLQLGSEFLLDENTSLKLQARGFREERGNGTIYTRNETSGTDASVVFTKRFPQVAAELRLTGYAQSRKYSSTFSSVNGARDLEIPALNQYDVPATASGGSIIWAMPLGSRHSLTLGFDARGVEGETNEAFRFVGNEFTRLRNAGGEELFLGLFAEETWKLSPAATIVGGIRIDRWQLSDGSRTETDRASGRVTLRSRFSDRDGFEVNGRLGSTAELTRSVSIRAAAYTGFRVPTLNELYRPFRVGNAVTEANADLQPEQLLGGEAGVDWRPAKAVRLAGTVFLNRLEDAIGNITIGFGPGTFDPGGFIPVGGVLRQRQNIDLVTAPGLELSGEWQVLPTVFLNASYIYTRPTIDRATESALVGNLLAQSPEHVATGSIEWKPGRRWLLRAEARYNASQFEDDQNAISLAPFFTVDAAVSYEFSAKVSAGLKVENLLNAEVETGKSGDGLVSIGTPRLVTLQLDYAL